MLATWWLPVPRHPSRNYRVGYALAQGKDLDDIVYRVRLLKVNTTRLVCQKAQELDIDMPLAGGLTKSSTNRFRLKRSFPS